MDISIKTDIFIIVSKGLGKVIIAVDEVYSMWVAFSVDQRKLKPPKIQRFWRVFCGLLFSLSSMLQTKPPPRMASSNRAREDGEVCLRVGCLGGGL
ncbi:hypothetical protein TorRG33x02_239280 [Trema orientale]|uniref:Uncharacterized protein n=1 Tax=Trema orientale TaxID=63057 RepID=A0A2P5DXQ5_TREOI|nr:hypothetical protein TorRG33x02_239280 [Trema orientale]